MLIIGARVWVWLFEGLSVPEGMAEGSLGHKSRTFLFCFVFVRVRGYWIDKRQRQRSHSGTVEIVNDRMPYDGWTEASMWENKYKYAKWNIDIVIAIFVDSAIDIPSKADLIAICLCVCVCVCVCGGVKPSSIHSMKYPKMHFENTFPICVFAQGNYLT